MNSGTHLGVSFSLSSSHLSGMCPNTGVGLPLSVTALRRDLHEGSQTCASVMVWIFSYPNYVDDKKKKDHKR